ncbi:hypothetical protein BJV74DRAFT_302853 [Russula compacta]|nr:hypothetical protein BJV74DRAFT_302853 [Russula compacta]
MPYGFDESCSIRGSMDITDTLPKTEREDEPLSDFICCGLSLPNFHAVVQHIELCHGVKCLSTCEVPLDLPPQPVASQLDVNNYSTPPKGLHPTLSSWLKNMNRLSDLVDRLHELASAAPSDHKPQPNRQVAALRATFKKQQERCVVFSQLSEEYANRYLLDISAEIQQQSSFLDILEKRLDMAKTLRAQAIDLRRSYESGTLDAMKKVRETGNSAFSLFPKAGY